MDTSTSINDNVDIFIYSHVPFKPIVSNPVYKVLTNNHAPDEEFQKYPGLPTGPLCGVTYNEGYKRNLPIYRDYTGDNISDKNLMFNEYAGFYWLLHNWDIKDYIGMIHYRRYFIILNKRFFLQYPPGGPYKSNREFYKIWHNVDDFDLMGKIVKENYPQYADGWDKMSNINYIFPSSLFIMPKELFREYVSFAIDVMNKFNDARGCRTPEEWIAYVEAHKDEYVRPQHKYYDVKMQSRAVGYLVERCLCAFLLAGDDPLIDHSVEYEWSVIAPSAYQTQKRK